MTAKTHGLTGSRTWKSWQQMKTRCYNPNSKDFPRYGARGIEVCERWQHSFESFLADMGPRPTGLTLDRVDSNLGYSPENCRWANSQQQGENTCRVIKIEINGVVKSLSYWAEQYGLTPSLSWKRIQRGWLPVDAVTTPRGVSGEKIKARLYGQ